MTLEQDDTSSRRRKHQARFPLRWITLSAWIVGLILYFHGGAVAPELRYTRIAEGNISHAVGAAWERGAQGFGEVLDDDAKLWGRVRPLHWAFYSAPFALTSIRNGDFFHHDTDVPRSQRINGDLQTHNAFLLAILSVTTLCVCVIMWYALGYRYAIILPLLFIANNRHIQENLLVNFCDSGEIGQILFIALYLLCIRKVLNASAPTKREEITGCIFLLLALLMKETSVVLLPTFGALVLWCFLVERTKDRAFLRFSIRHILVHLLLVAALLICVYANRAGSYVGVNYQLSQIPLARLLDTWERIRMGSVTLRYLGIALLFGLGVRAMMRSWRWPTARRFSSALRLLGISMLLLCAFWVINLPWAAQLPKYYLPVYLFACVAALSIWKLVYDALSEQGLIPAASLWWVGSLVFIFWEGNALHTPPDAYYRRHYEYRKTVPFVANDIAKRVAPEWNLHVRLVAGNLFQAGNLSFVRVLNRSHQVNILSGDKVVHEIPSAESNYLRRYMDRPGVMVSYSDALPTLLKDDLVYLWGNPPEEASALLGQGYRLTEEWSVGSPGLRLALYEQQ
jgi:hypothetical protein